MEVQPIFVPLALHCLSPIKTFINKLHLPVCEIHCKASIEKLHYLETAKQQPHDLLTLSAESVYRADLICLCSETLLKLLCGRSGKNTAIRELRPGLQQTND